MDQKQALNILKLGHNVFLTGAAGSGKTHLLNQYIKYLRSNQVIVGITASTGIAATHMNGKTIHSWAHLGIKDELTASDLSRIVNREDYKTKLLNTKVLIIDEVSMLHHFRFDMVNQVLQKVHQNDLAFGGIQVILCGDLFQLPPVTRGNQMTKYINDSDVWNKMNIKICYLTEQYRQDGGDFLQLLDEIRHNDVSEYSSEKLQERMHKDIDMNIQPTKLYTHNIDVDSINDTELDKLSTEDHLYQMVSHGDKNLVKPLIDNCLAPNELHIRKGAVVMFVQNNFSKGYVNGTLGEVVGFSKEGNYPTVKTLNGKIINAIPASWRIEEGEEVVAEITQVPLRLAWAITVHKSQGMTLDAAQIDLSRAFVSGMGYVALSRVKSLDGIKLLGINSIALRVDPRVTIADITFRQNSLKVVDELNSMRPGELKKLHNEYIEEITFNDSK
ncbi:MAG TPA: PIF1 family DEAD/DEAH box helicase [Candidatus Saccharimonadales bacterium]